MVSVLRSRVLRDAHLAADMAWIRPFKSAGRSRRRQRERASYDHCSLGARVRASRTRCSPCLCLLLYQEVALLSAVGQLLLASSLQIAAEVIFEFAGASMGHRRDAGYASGPEGPLQQARKIEAGTELGAKLPAARGRDAFLSRTTHNTPGEIRCSLRA